MDMMTDEAQIEVPNEQFRKLRVQLTNLIKQLDTMTYGSNEYLGQLEVVNKHIRSMQDFIECK